MALIRDESKDTCFVQALLLYRKPDECQGEFLKIHRFFRPDGSENRSPSGCGLYAAPPGCSSSLMDRLNCTANMVAVVQTANLDPNAYARHTAVRFSFEPRLIHLFDPETEKNLI